MKKVMGRPVLICLLGVVLLLVQAAAFAADTVKDELSNKYREGKDICSAVKNTILEGQSSKEVTKTGIMMGHEACLVIRCALDAKGELEQVIAGALEAGTTSDVCSRCAINAGADPAAVAKALQSGLGYSVPVGPALQPVEVSPPAGSTNGGNISPSGF